MSYQDQFLKHLQVQKRYSPRTIDLYREAISGFYLFISLPEENNELIPLEYNNIRSYISSLANRKLSARSINLKLSALSSFCSYLYKEGLLSSNPVKKVRRPKQSKPLPGFYPKEAIERYFEGGPAGDSFSEFRDRIVVEVIYTTGIRRAELAGLKIGDYDRSRGLLRVTGKGGKSREIPVTEELKDALDGYLKLFMEEYPDNPSGYMFLTDSGQPFYLSFVNKIVRRELQKAGGFDGKKSPHVLRHSIATHLLNNGADLNSIKEVLGHSSLAATQVYTHNSFEQLKKTFIKAHPRAKKGG